MGDCSACSPGMYCPGFGNTAPQGNCSAGYYCSINASVASPVDGTTGDQCPIGHYCPAGTSQPNVCPPGTFTDTQQNSACLRCTSGHYCTNGSHPQDCPAGFYCPAGTGYVWQPCPAGTYSSLTGLANETQCTVCPGGSYCSEINATAVSGPCSPGYYCAYGSNMVAPSGGNSGDAGICPVGHYCKSGTSVPTACPAGTFNKATMVTSESGCTSCLPGYYCNQTGLEFPVGLCEPGFYCLGGSVSSQPPNATSTGGPCPPGSYCPEGSSNHINCPSGTYSPAAMSSNCTDCPPGYYCRGGSSSIDACPKGE
jgi:hypothetical protein